MQDKTTHIINIKESKESKESINNEDKEKKFIQRFTLPNILKIVYLLLSVSFGHGIFSLILYFMANKKYGLVLTICSVTSGTLHFLYESYKVLYAEELLIKKIIMKRRIKLRLINSNIYNYDSLITNIKKSQNLIESYIKSQQYASAFYGLLLKDLLTIANKDRKGEVQNLIGNMYDKGKVFSSLGKLFNHFFITNGININK